MKDRKTEVFRVLKFLFFEVSAGVVEFVSFTLLNELTPMSYWPCYLIALILSVVWSFTFNRAFTFRSAASVPIAMAKVLLYYAMFTPLSTLAGEYLAGKCGWNEYIVTGLNMLVNLITEYLWDTFVVFRKSIDTNERAKRKLNKMDQVNPPDHSSASQESTEEGSPKQ